MEVSAKKYVLGAIKKIKVFQTSVSRRREATFWIIGPLWENVFPQMFQIQRKGCQILMSRNSSPDPADPADPGNPVQEVRPGTSLPHAPGFRMT